MIPLRLHFPAFSTVTQFRFLGRGNTTSDQTPETKNTGTEKSGRPQHTQLGHTSTVTVRKGVLQTILASASESLSSRTTKGLVRPVNFYDP